MKHGSVHVMTQQSQPQWKHCLQYEPDVTGSRLSFTFHKLRSEPTPIAPPSAVKISAASAGDRLKRVLFLTDSVLSTLSSSPEYLFEAAQKHVYQEDKLSAGRVADIDNFSPEFAHSDIVIVSCGINDLSRYGKTAETLADIALQRVRYPNTKFIRTACY